MRINHFEIRTCNLIIGYYVTKKYNARLRIIYLLSLQIEQLNAGKVVEEVFNEIINLDKLIIVYEIKITETKNLRSKFVGREKTNPTKNTLQLRHEHSGIQSNVLPEIKNTSNSNSIVPFNRRNLLELTPSFKHNLSTLRYAQNNT